MSEVRQESNNPIIRSVLAKWRNAVSITEDNETGGLYLHRYDKKQQRWIQLLYFKSQDDFEEFIDFLESIFDGEEEED